MAENKEIIETLISCKDALEKVSMCERYGKNNTLELLEILQGTAISVGEAIEQDYGTRQAAVWRLEEYCELLYQIHVKLEKDNIYSKEVDSLIIEANRKIDKAVLIMKRVMGIDVSGQLHTYHDRPKYADEVGIFSDKKLKYKTAIVLQGPLKKDDDFTLETIRLYKRLYPECALVLSTWLDEEDYLKPFYEEQIIVCTSKKPIHSGALNCSYQAVSSYAGIARAKEMGYERICKTRTDQRFYLPDLFSYLEDMIDLFPLRIQTTQKERLIAISYSTISNRPYHVCDMFLYGEASDVIRYFSDKVDDRDWEPVKWKNNIEYSKQRAGEVWFTANYLESLGAELKWTLDDSDYYIRELFLILDSSLLDLYWSKYSDDEYNDRTYNDVSFQCLRGVTFFEWLHDYRTHNI